MSVLRAEWDKAVKHYLLTSFLVLVFPVGVAGFFALMIIASLLFDSVASGIAGTTSGAWTKDSLGIWSFVSTFPSNIFGRLLPLAFVAVMFAGEYQWGTWKNILPRAGRTRLVLAKYVTLTFIIMLSLLATAVLVVIGQTLGHLVVDLPYGPALSGAVLREYFPDLLRHVLLGLLALLAIAGFAALASILTRSILGGLLVGFGLSLADPISLFGLFVFGRLIGQPSVINLYRFTTTFNLDNLRSWFVAQEPAGVTFGGFTAEFSATQSILLMLIWIVLLLGLAITIFQRQDISS